MKVVILAGGLGTRLAEETEVRPKPMIEIGGRPILWHIMKTYSHYGLNDFVVCLGYRGYVIKEYFSNYFLHMSNVTFDLRKNEMQVHHNEAEPWRVTLVDTGMDTQTGGRLARVRQYLGDERFCFTYGDGLGDIDIAALIAFHDRKGVQATLTAVRPPARFGAVELDAEQRVTAFHEKPLGDGGWISGGFFVLEPGVIDLVAGDATVWEREPLEGLSARGELAAYVHDGFWQPMDTLRDKLLLENAWRSGQAPWKVWP
ncbi:MAG: glucose-1-phosphate cytidylyltransferase [Acidobacteriota bacterium]